MILPIPNEQTLPVIRITIVANAVQVGENLRARYVVRDNGGDFHTEDVHVIGDRPEDRERARSSVDRIVYHCTAEAGTAATPVIGTTCDACSCAMEDAADVA